MDPNTQKPETTPESIESIFGGAFSAPLADVLDQENTSNVSKDVSSDIKD